jgi:hypothetical protein
MMEKKPQSNPHSKCEEGRRASDGFNKNYSWLPLALGFSSEGLRWSERVLRMIQDRLSRMLISQEEEE